MTNDRLTDERLAEIIKNHELEMEDHGGADMYSFELLTQIGELLREVIRLRGLPAWDDSSAEQKQLGETRLQVEISASLPPSNHMLQDVVRILSADNTRLQVELRECQDSWQDAHSGPSEAQA